MKNLYSLLANAAFAIQVFLLFLWIFESQVSIPMWLQPLGRMHPLVLHFPIVLWIIVAILPFLKRHIVEESYEPMEKIFLYTAVIMTSLTAMMGFFLAREGGYGADAMQLHKWGGLLMSFVGYVLLLAYPRVRQRQGLFRGVLLASVLLLVGASHFGAELTHGENFVFAPLQGEKEEAALDPSQPIAQEMILRILDSKCQSCHNPRKSKGDLDLTTVDALFVGGETGAAIEVGHAGESRLIQRTLLPLEEDEHMPPEGKPQPTEAEIALLQAWIEAGASQSTALDDLEDSSLLALTAHKWIASQNMQMTDGPTYRFKAAPRDLIQDLNTPFRRVAPLSANSPALEASLFVRETYSQESLRELEPISQQLVFLNLGQLPVQDEDLKLIAGFPQLEKLILNGTDITTQGLRALQACQKLKTLAVTSTAIGQELGDVLKQWKQLEEVFVWNTTLDTSDVQALTSRYPDIVFDGGFVPDEGETLAMSPPQLLTEKEVISPEDEIEFKHNFPGVTIRYTVDGTEPDSANGTIYTEPFTLEGFTKLQAIAYHEGWISSRIVSQTFFKQGIEIVESKLENQPHKRYMGSGALTLYDRKKGKISPHDGPLWIGYKDTPFSAVMDMGKNPELSSSITLSCLRKTGSYIMPPQSVELWGGMEQDKMKKLGRLRPQQPTESMPNEIIGVHLDFDAAAYRYFRVVAKPVNSLPAWHRGAGDKGWVFIDEVMVN